MSAPGLAAWSAAHAPRQGTVSDVLTRRLDGERRYASLGWRWSERMPVAEWRVYLHDAESPGAEPPLRLLSLTTTDADVACDAFLRGTVTP